MGAKQSTPRRISIPNEENAGFIKISDSVVSRLKGSADSANDSALAKPVDVRTPQSSSTLQGGQVASAIPQDYNEPSRTSLQILQEKELELRKNDQYWEQRLVTLQENHRHINKVMEQEYEKAVKQVSSRFKNDSKQNYEPPCQEKRSSVAECYKMYPKNTLQCSTAVQAFSNCVDASRHKALFDNRA